MCGHHGQHGRPVQNAVIDQGAPVEGQGAFKADDAEGCRREVGRLGLGRVRGVICCQDGDRSIGDAFLEPGDVGFRSKRWVHLRGGVVPVAGGLGQEQVVGRGFTCGRLAGGPGVSQQVDAATAADVLGVVASADGRIDFQVTLDHGFLGLDRPAHEPQSGGERSGVHDGAAGHRRNLAVLHEARVVFVDCFQHRTHHGIVLDAVAVIGDAYRTSFDEFADGGTFSTSSTDRAAPDGVDPGKVGFTGAVIDVLDPARRIEGRDGVWHAGDGGESSSDRCRRARLDGLLVELSLVGVPEMHVDVQQARADDAALGLDHVAADRMGRGAGFDGRDATIDDQHISGRVEFAGGIDDPASTNQQGSHGCIVPAG